MLHFAEHFILQTRSVGAQPQELRFGAGVVGLVSLFVSPELPLAEPVFAFFGATAPV
jgi:hypothetical protein